MKIIVEAKTARLYRDLDAFGKMDPYVTISCGGTKVKGKTHSGGGKNPSWSDTLSIKTTDDTMTLTVWDEDPGKDDFVGSTAIDISKIQYSGGVLKDWISIYHKGKEAGQVYVEITIADSKTAAAATYYAAPAPAPAAYYPTAPAPATYYPSAPAYAPAPTYTPAPTYAPATAYAPAPAYPSAYPTAYPTAPAPTAYYPATTAPATYYPAPAPAPAPAYPATYTAYPGTTGTTYQAPGYGGHYGYQ